MTQVDTPDYQRGVVSAQKLLATVASGTDTVTVGVPPNAETLAVIVDQSGGDEIITVKGATTGSPYVTAAQVLTIGGVSWQIMYVDVSSALDSSVIVTLTPAPAAAWYVYSDSGVHIVFDPTLASVVTQDGGGLPADMLTVGGDWNGTAKIFRTNSSGQLLTVDQSIVLAVAATGAAAPADALQIAGTDGADLRALKVNTSGELLTVDQEIAAVSAAPGAAAPADALQIAGTDGTDLRALLTDPRGVPFTVPSPPGTASSDHPPTELQSIGSAPSNGDVVLGSPGAGLRYRIFTAQVVSQSTDINGWIYDTGTQGAICAGTSVAPSFASFAPFGLPLSTDGGVSWNTSVGSGDVIVLVTYTIETV